MLCHPRTLYHHVWFRLCRLRTVYEERLSLDIDLEFDEINVTHNGIQHRCIDDNTYIHFDYLPGEAFPSLLLAEFESDRIFAEMTEATDHDGPRLWNGGFAALPVERCIVKAENCEVSTIFQVFLTIAPDGETATPACFFEARAKTKIVNENIMRGTGGDTRQAEYENCFDNGCLIGPRKIDEWQLIRFKGELGKKVSLLRADPPNGYYPDGKNDLRCADHDDPSRDSRCRRLPEVLQNRSR